jgi:hypothetical protein
MGVPNKQIGWSQESNLLWQISKQLDKASCQLCTISGTSGTSGTSGYDGDRFRTTSTTEFTLGVTTTIVVEPGLAYTPAQDIIITYNVGNHQTCTVVSYDINTGVMVVGGPVTVTGSGTYSSWTVNLDGAAGGDGSSGTSGTSGTRGTSGTSPFKGAYVSGTTYMNGDMVIDGLFSYQSTINNNTNEPSSLSGWILLNGLDGSSGTSGSAGTSGSSGTSPTLPGSANYGLFAQTANSTIITNTTVETSLINGGVGTLTVPANGFSVGDSFRAVFGGLLTATNNQTIRVRVKAGSIILVDSGAQTITNITDNVFTLNVDFTIRQLGAAGVASIVTLGAFHYTKTVNGAVEGFAFNTVNSTTFNTTISNVLDVTIQWGAASAANTIYSDIFILNKTY